MKRINYFFSDFKDNFKELLRISFPLIISSSIWTFQQCLNRIFLSWYSIETMAAVLPSSLLSITFLSIFTGIASFVNTFVAQYYGANQYSKIGEIVWTGIYIAFLGFFFHLFLIPVSPYIFKLFGHEVQILNYEIIYFQILCFNSFPVIASHSLSSFFSGRGQTLPILGISLFQTVVNLIFDYLLIFGKWIFPEMGIKGAGIATVISSYLSFFIYFFLFIMRKYEIYSTRKFLFFNKNLFLNLLKYGVPNGIQFFLEIVGWSIFLLFIGKLGKIPLASTNIAFTINTIAFMPMLGIGTGVSVLVGQYIGKGMPEKGEKIAFTGFLVTFFYMAFIAFLYVVYSDIFINPFNPKIYTENFDKVKNLTRILLRFVAFYSLFDTMNIIFISALRGAGDTGFIMRIFLYFSIFLLIFPTYISVFLFPSSIFIPWIIATGYVVILGIVFLLRFTKGEWKKLKIIEFSDIKM